ncbi:TrkH family potassium uptake protein [Bacteroides sp. 224]|uniref:TrkH family potassium uptake protein n=1 Tax=Bacteroides sp. 224 TaxID=2302936 RepID=UPI0013D71F8B|nr:potassium transporter TrkG [Bacteroides sp. 224]NDV67025.1 TrkH family potassium uptake protein [Bacteroides sp. 224]
MINLKTIYKIMGLLVLVETVMLICCIGVSLLYQEDDLISFTITTAITLVIGLGLLLAGRGSGNQFNKRDSIIIVSFSWIIVSALGMLPFYISGYIPDITNAFFETISGFTSTGSTILDDIESLPHGLLFWRSMTQWIGGLGIVFFTLAVLPVFGVGGVQLFAAEASGFTYDKVHPRIGTTAKWIWSIYSGLTIIVAILLWLGGMNVFDSICHAFATAGTGGYSTKQTSIEFYNSPYIEYVISIFMTISGMNFILLLFFVNGKFKKFFQDTELKWYLISIFTFTTIITLGLYKTTPMGVEEAFRKAFFQVTSLHTSTGLATTDYMTWSPFLWALLLIIMIIGACAGSTSGGIKCIRVVMLAKIANNEFKRMIHPNAVLPVRINKRVAPPTIVSSVLAFIFVYLVIIIISCLILIALGVGFEESIGTVISSIGNMGPGVGSTGPAYSWNALPDIAKWLCAFLMLIGRLELFTILILFSPGFWRKR